MKEKLFNTISFIFILFLIPLSLVRADQSDFPDKIQAALEDILDAQGEARSLFERSKFETNTFQLEELTEVEARLKAAIGYLMKALFEKENKETYLSIARIKINGVLAFLSSEVADYNVELIRKQYADKIKIRRLQEDN